MNHSASYLLKSPLAALFTGKRRQRKVAAKRRGRGYASAGAASASRLRHGGKTPKGSVFNEAGGLPRSAAPMGGGGGGDARAWRSADNGRRGAAFGMCRIEMLITLSLYVEIKAEDIPHLRGE